MSALPPLWPLVAAGLLAVVVVVLLCIDAIANDVRDRDDRRRGR